MLSVPTKALLAAFVVTVALALALGVLVSQAPRAATVTAALNAAGPQALQGPKAPARLPATDWPIFRANQALVGVAGGELPAKLEKLWSFKTGGAVYSSPVISGGKVVFGSSDGRVYALNEKTGEPLWVFTPPPATTQPDVSGAPQGQSPGVGFEAAPLLHVEMIFIGSADGILYALDTQTGQLRWQYATDGEIKASANWWTTPDGQRHVIVVGSYDNKLHCVDRATGQAVWTYDTGNYINGAAAIADGKAIFGGCDGLVHIVDMATGRAVKTVEAGGYVPGSAAVFENRAYVGTYDNEVLAVDLSAGQVAWRYKQRGFPYFSSAAVDRDLVVIGGRDKRVHGIVRQTGKPAWAFTTRGQVDSSPVICGDDVVVGSDDGRLYVLRLRNGQERWSFDLGAKVSATPAIAGGLLVVGAEDGTVTAFGARN